MFIHIVRPGRRLGRCVCALNATKLAFAGYWAKCMRQNDIDVAAFDKYPPLSTDGSPRKLLTDVHDGGPEVLASEEHAGK